MVEKINTILLYFNFDRNMVKKVTSMQNRKIQLYNISPMKIFFLLLKKTRKHRKKNQKSFTKITKLHQ